MSEITDEMNFHQMVLDKSKTRKHMEGRGRDGQKKQAEDVNKGRGGDEGPIPRWTVCTITMPKDRDKMTPNHLPALICNTFKYKNTGTIRYKCCTEHGIIQGTLGREQLNPKPHMVAAGIGVNYEALDKTKFITLTEAGQLYTPLSGKLSNCRCRKNDCSRSKYCSCRKMGKFCTTLCHGGNGNNPYCRNCPPAV